MLKLIRPVGLFDVAWVHGRWLNIERARILGFNRCGREERGFWQIEVSVVLPRWGFHL